jgi:hypothetical protein
VPIEGSLDDPQFHIGKVVTRTILNILTKVATSPFSLLGAVFGGGGEELGYQDFAPGGAELSPADRQKLDLLVKGLYARPGLQLEISGSVDPVADRDGLRHVSLEEQLHTKKWLSLRKSERAATAPGQLVLTPEERTRWIKKLYGEALASGRITPALIAADTNLAAFAALIQPRAPEIRKGATILMKGQSSAAQSPARAVAAAPSPSQLAPPADPMEILLLAAIPITDNDFETLAEDRAKAVRAYILQSGKVEVSRLFLTENQTGGVRSDGSRVYVQFQ